MGTTLYDESAFRKISTSLLYHARANPEFRDRLRKALASESTEEEPAASLPSQCEAFAAVLYHGNRRAAEENHPEDASIPDPVAPGAFAPADVRPKEIASGEERPGAVVRPARLRELVEEVAYNSDLPDRRTIGVEAAVAHLVLDE
jgi:hypothetical protein